MNLPENIDNAADLLRSQNYIADRSLATALFLSLKLERPLFLEGEAGVGKTEIAKVLAKALDRELIRLQCYEGLDVTTSVYEWNFPRQMIELKMAETTGGKKLGNDIFDERFLIKRPILKAMEEGENGPPVLLIDELDRSDEPFEAFLLEVLSDFQVTIPEMGVIKARTPPIVVITSNRTREIHDAIKRRCFYYWVDYPSAEVELEILKVKAPATVTSLSEQIVAFVQSLRKQDLFKQPGVAESIDWAHALTQLDVVALNPEVVSDTLGVLLKYQDDIAKIKDTVASQILQEIQSELILAQSSG